MLEQTCPYLGKVNAPVVLGQGVEAYWPRKGLKTAGL